jgi:hypothetical protein
MRVIKFRGLRTDGGGWAYGNLINWHPNLKPRIIWFEQVGETSQELDFNETNDEVHPKTVGQFTGLLDKNGVEIYEGDYYKDEDGDMFVVMQMECGRYALKMISNNYIDEFVDWNHIEVIGNIHELTT